MPLSTHDFGRFNVQELKLTMEQQFAIRSFETQVGSMSREQAQSLLIELYRQMVAKDALYQHMLRKQWGLVERGTDADQ